MGMLFFAIFCFWGYFILTNATPTENFFWMLVTRGIGLPLLFIPITSLSLSTLKGPEIGQGVAFTGMMRQVGGSFGVAIITTFMARQNMFHRSALVSHLSVDDPVVMARVNTLQHGFMAKGMPPNAALQSAYKVLDYTVSGQANVLSYMDVFYYLGIIFLICIPFVLFVKRNKQKPALAEAMH
jgi:DHA2 family multidrug resistance protein